MISVFPILRTGFYLLSGKTWQTINLVTSELLNDYIFHRWDGKPRKIFVLTVGFSGSGKSTLIRKNLQLSQFFRVQTDEIHGRLNAQLKFLQDDKTTTGPAFWPRHILTLILRFKVLNEACRRGIPLVLDSCNLVRIERQAQLKIPRNYGYKIVTILIEGPEKELLRRIEEREKANDAAGMPRTWLKLYRDVQQPLFDRPTVREADQLVHFWSGQQRPEEVSDWIGIKS
ncbi:MAG: ATP-binding protein [Patescibacteria group bacterium]